MDSSAGSCSHLGPQKFARARETLGAIIAHRPAANSAACKNFEPDFVGALGCAKPAAPAAWWRPRDMQIFHLARSLARHDHRAAAAIVAKYHSTGRQIPTPKECEQIDRTARARRKGSLGRLRANQRHFSLALAGRVHTLCATTSRPSTQLDCSAGDIEHARRALAGPARNQWADCARWSMTLGVDNCLWPARLRRAGATRVNPKVCKILRPSSSHSYCGARNGRPIKHGA